ncbi:hypothetical protein ACJJIQ_00180 (plasmid) [Microbulbifer sp. ANSA003]|uniref:hypothetical protein n=1 Tax=Microbulbifer sp. ANSA003 TaxID=3243360 RepID=UPI0040431E50
MVGKVFAGLIGGLVVALLGYFQYSIMAVDIATQSEPSVVPFFVVWVLAMVVACTAKRTGKAWRRLLLISAILCFLLPISGLVFTGNAVADTASGAEAAGAAIGGGLVSGFMGFVGFFLGIIFLIVGLLTGRDKQVIVVREGDAIPES